MSKDELKALIRRAAARQRVTRYEIGKRLGYKNKSAIYSIESGRKGLSAAKLFELARMAGKSLLFVIFTSSILTNSAPSDAGEMREAFNLSIHYAYVRNWLRRLIQSFASCPSPA